MLTSSDVHEEHLLGKCQLLGDLYVQYKLQAWMTYTSVKTQRD